MKKMILIIVSIIYFVFLFAVVSEMSAAITVTPHYFEHDGESIFLLGLGNWIFINKIDVDYVAHNQWYESYRINYNRITLTSTWYTDTLIQVFPWNRSTIPGANDGGNKFDLNEMDTTFWDRLHGYLQDCENREIVVCIQFFDECAVEHGSDPHRWDYHPFNPQNNINNIPDLNTYDASYSSSTGWSQSFYNVDNTYPSPRAIGNFLTHSGIAQGESFILPAKLEWDGKDFRNKGCPTGFYFCRFEVENIVEIKKLLLMR